MLAQTIIESARSQGWTVATCESLTAGLLAATIAQVPGASAVLRGGLITYDTDVKASLAGVNPRTLEKYGPVSAQTAHEMAQGAARVLKADIAVSLTGVAGPQEQDGHPVGQVFVGVAFFDQVSVTQLALEGSRNEIRQAAVAATVEILEKRMKSAEIASS